MANAQITGNENKSRRRKAIESVFVAAAVVFAATGAIAMIACANYTGERARESYAPFRRIQDAIERGYCNRGDYIGKEIHFKKASSFDELVAGVAGNLSSGIPPGSGDEKIVDVQVGTTLENGVKIIFEDNETKERYSLSPRQWPSLDCLNALKNG